MSRNFQPPSRHNIIAQLFVQCRNIMSGMQHLTWSDPTELLPALLTIIMVLLSFSIANGIAAGFLIKLRAAQGDCGENVRRERRGLGDVAHFFGPIGVFFDARPSASSQNIPT